MSLEKKICKKAKKLNVRLIFFRKNSKTDFNETLKAQKLPTTNLIEIGNNAVWSLSSAKPGYGIEKLRDDNLETYWQ